MPTLFTPSTLTWASAIGQIADSAGASGDAEMRTRALASLRASFQFLNSKKWEFTRTEASPIQVIGPFIVTGITASGGSSTVSAVGGHGIKPDDAIFSTRGFILGARVSATAASSFTFNGTITGFTGTATADGSFGRDFYDLPSDWKVGYSVRLLSSQRPLGYIQRRIYDRIISDEYSFGTPEGYDQFQIGAKGKIRLVPGPGTNDVLQLRYYRRMYLGTATGDTTALDIPEDYELTPIAWAKWHFLTDKGERSDQAQTWVALAKEGLTTMLADQTQIPDEGLVYLPGTTTYFNQFGDRSTRYIPWEYTG